MTSRRVVARSATCCYCEAPVLLAVCFDGQRRAFGRRFHADREEPLEVRWWLTRGLGMVHGGVAQGCPSEWVSLHHCRSRAGLSGVDAIGDLLGLSVVSGGC